MSSGRVGRLPHPAIRKWLDDNQQALRLLNVGSKKPKALIEQPKDYSFLSRIEIAKHQALSRLALLQATRLRHTEDVSGAWKWYRIAFRHSRHTGMYGGNIDRIMGVALHSFVARASIEWASDPRVNTVLLRQAIEDVILDYQLTQPPSTTLRSDYFGSRYWIDNTEMLEGLTGIDASAPVIRGYLFLKNEPEVSSRLIDLTYAKWLSQIDLPKHLQTRRTGKLQLFEPVAGAPISSEPSPADIEDFFSHSAVASWVIGGMQTQLDRSITRERMFHSQLVVILAVQLFFREHGRFPHSSAEFIDDYLKDWPNDPYIRKETPMHYRLDVPTEEAIVWSDGPNGISHGGQVAELWDETHLDFGATIRPPTESDSPSSIPFDRRNGPVSAEPMKSAAKPP